MTISLQYTNITVSDVDEALPFYRDALGLEVTQDVSAGDHRLDAYPPLGEQRTPDGWSVRLDAPDGPVTVGLVETSSAPLLSTCAATQALPVRQWSLAGIES